jgi:hypothetical protein
MTTKTNLPIKPADLTPAGRSLLVALWDAVNAGLKPATPGEFDTASPEPKRRVDNK